MNPLDALRRWTDHALPLTRRVGKDDVSTQLHHAIVCALLGGVGATSALTFGADPVTGFRVAWTLVWLAYVVRERAQWRGQRWSWDAWGDVLVPVLWSAAALAGPSARAVWATVGASAVLGLYLTAARPRSA